MSGGSDSSPDVQPSTTRPRAGNRSWVPAWLRPAIDFVYPSVCSLCQCETSAGRPLCPPCERELIGSPTNVCRRCCAPVGPYLDTIQGCVHCRTDRFAFERIFALGAYDGPLRAACLRTKHDPTDRMADVLCGLLLDRWGDDLLAFAVDAVVPIPAHWTTRAIRASRPADAIAHRIGAFLKAPCDHHILRKSRRTPAQSTLTPARRRENLRNAFRLAAGVQLKGLRVLLVDDVLTTGTTADRASRVLKQAGCGEICVAVIARGIGR